MRLHQTAEVTSTVQAHDVCDPHRDAHPRDLAERGHRLAAQSAIRGRPAELHD
jgi:hypothetical protein